MKTHVGYDRAELRRLMNGSGVIHPRFGDLMDHGSVLMSALKSSAERFREKNYKFIHLSVTQQCNARCRGCINTFVTGRAGRKSIDETDPVRDARAIAGMIRTVGVSRSVVCLYGGEPLLRPEKIRLLMREIERHLRGKNPRYMLYTNGGLIASVMSKFPDILERVWLLSVSIDGRRRQHETVRTGTKLDVIESNLKRFRKSGSPHVMMWSTLRERQSLWDCFCEFSRLRRRGLVDSFFWHWAESPEPFQDFAAYLRRYERELKKIMDVYMREMEFGRRVLPVTHLNELVLFLLTGRGRGTTACGVECPGNYDIVGGKIYVCADLPQKMDVGTIDSRGQAHIRQVDLSDLAAYKKDLGCRRCGVVGYCGGRCPVQATMSVAGRLLEYCQLMRLHVGTVVSYLPRVRQGLRRAGMSLQDIYDSVVVWNQFTDVTP